MRYGSAFRGAAISVALTAAAASAQAQNVSARSLIAAARDTIAKMEYLAASEIIQRALRARPGPTGADSVWAYLLLAASELYFQREAIAMDHFRVALRIAPDLRVDSLAAHDWVPSDYREVFARVLATAGQRRARTTLEFRYVGGQPRGARLLVDGERWTELTREVDPGVFAYQVSARGYQDRVDSVRVDSGQAVAVDIALRPSNPARLSVTTDPAGIVFLDDERLGETPIVDRGVAAGDATLRIESPGGPALRQQIRLRSGELQNLGTLGASGPPPSPSAASAPADTAYFALRVDAALARYSWLALDQSAAPAAERARAATRVAVLYYAIALSRNEQTGLDSARAWVRRAFNISQGYRPSPGEYGDSVLAMLSAVRASVLTLQPFSLRDTTVRVTDSRLRIPLAPSRSARVTVAVTGPAGVVREESQTVSGQAFYDWNLRGRDGDLVPADRYTIRVTAVDSLLGEVAQPVERTVTLSRVVVDTVPMPAPPPASELLPDSERVRPGSAVSVLGGLVLAGAAVVLPTALGSSELKSRIGAADPAPFVVAGTAAVAGLVGYLSGTHQRLNRENVRRNEARQEQYRRDLDEARRTNQDRRANADIRITVEGGSP